MAQMPSVTSDADVIYDGPSPAPERYGPNGTANDGYYLSDNYAGMGCGDACGDGACSDYGSAGYGMDGCYADVCNNCGSACCNPCFVGHVDWLYLQASGADVSHAQQQNGLGGAGTVPFGEIGEVDTQYDSGVRVGFDVACGPCSGISASYTYFETDGLNSVDAPTVPGGGGAVGSLVHHPGAAITASAGPVDATYEVDYQMFDLMCRSELASGPCFSANGLFGVQYGNLEQVFGQTGVFGGGQGGTIDTISSVDFDGGGLKAGLDAERRLGRGLSVYGRLTGAVMTGRFSSRYSMLNSSTDVLLAEANWKDDRIVPQVEYEIGIGWTSPSDRWRIAAGYMYSHWLNTVTVPEYIDAVQADNYVDVEDTLSFEGWVTRLECRW